MSNYIHIGPQTFVCLENKPVILYKMSSLHVLSAAFSGKIWVSWGTALWSYVYVIDGALDYSPFNFGFSGLLLFKLSFWKWFKFETADVSDWQSPNPIYYRKDKNRTKFKSQARNNSGRQTASAILSILIQFKPW